MRISAMKNTQAKVSPPNGFRLAISVDGTLTGRGGDIIIIDDPSPRWHDPKVARERPDWYLTPCYLGSMITKRRHRARDAAAAPG
jgi:hypothetical protein